MMKLTSKFIALGAGCLALAASGPAARATDLFNDPADAITAANSSTQTGRLGRDVTGANDGYGLQQTWTPADNGITTYPGVGGAAGATFNYVEFTFTPADLGNGQYIQVDFDEPTAADLFASAWTTYSGTASVASGTGFLGDAGQSENYRGDATTPRYFNVVVPAGASLTVVVNTTNATALGETFGIQIEDFTDTEYTDAINTAPEPSTWATFGVGGLVLGGVTVSRRRKAAATV